MVWSELSEEDILAHTSKMQDRIKAVKAAKQAAKAKKEIMYDAHVPKGDMVFENAVLYVRDALLTREFSDAIKAGDSGRVLVILKLWVFSYRGSGRTKYAHEMLHLLHNILHVWPTGIRSVTQSSYPRCRYLQTSQPSYLAELAAKSDWET